MSKIVSKFMLLKPNEYSTIFKASNQDIIVTVELLNTNKHAVDLSAGLFLGKSQINTSITSSVGENKSFKKFNVLIKANSPLNIKVGIPGIAARIYTAAFFAKPGYLNLEQGETKEVEFFLEHNGEYVIEAGNKPSGIIISPAAQAISEGHPAKFTITRAQGMLGVGPALFKIPQLKIATAIDIMIGIVEEIDDGVSDDCEEADFDADLVSAYISGRDRIIG